MLAIIFAWVFLIVRLYLDQRKLWSREEFEKDKFQGDRSLMNSVLDEVIYFGKIVNCSLCFQGQSPSCSNFS
jgi:hypothetical protein